MSSFFTALLVPTPTAGRCSQDAQDEDEDAEADAARNVPSELHARYWRMTEGDPSEDFNALGFQMEETEPFPANSRDLSAGRCLRGSA